MPTEKQCFHVNGSVTTYRVSNSLKIHNNSFSHLLHVDSSTSGETDMASNSSLLGCYAISASK